MKNILILTSFNGNFYSKRYQGRPNKKISINEGLDINILTRILTGYGYNVSVKKYEELDLSENYKNYYIVYHSCEDLGFNYRSYIEDKLSALELQGAILIPKYSYMKAHGNKTMMELIRDTLPNKFKTITSLGYSLPESVDYNKIKYPVVVKSAYGSGGESVHIAKDEKNFKKIILKISKNPLEYANYKHIKKILRCWISQRILKNKPETTVESYYFNRNMKKFIVQNFIPNLKGDYKVLVFYDKYYVLKRENRDKDFRASGSGKFTYPGIDEIKNVLEYAREFINVIDTPWASLDIAENDSTLHLIEFQFLSFGTYTIINSDSYFFYNNGVWYENKMKSDLEETFAASLVKYLESKFESRITTL